jgi:hypothetical protein
LALVALFLRSAACGESFSAAENSDGGAGGITSDDGSAAAHGDSTAGSGGSAESGGSGGSGGNSGSTATDSAVPADADAKDSDAPPEIPTDGLLLWLRADRGVTEENGAVAIWADQSGNDLHATQTASNVRPKLVRQAISGQPSIEFDGVDDFMRLASGFTDFSAGASIFTVVQRAPTSGCNAVLELSNGPEIDDVSLGEFNQALYYEVYNGWTGGGALETDTPLMLAVVHHTNLTLEMRRNGQLSGEGSTDLPSTVLREQNFVGRSLYADCVVFPGQIGEVLIYARAVSDAELLSIEAYLRSRWACCSG